MKRFIIPVIVLFFMACGSADKSAELINLKKQRDELDIKIKDLEAQLVDSTKIAIKLTEVTVLTLAEGVFNHYVEVQGKLDGEENVGATAQTVGVLKIVNVKVGDAVSKGQILAQMDASVYEQTLKELESSLEFVTDIYNRQKELWEQKVGSEVQYLTAKNNKESLEGRIKTLKEQLDMTRITSPITGTIEEVSVKVGQAVAPGFNAFRVVNFSRVKVMADVSETYAAKIKKGNEAILRFPDIDYEVKSVVDFTSKFINPVNRTFLIEIRFAPEANIEYKANMVAYTKINDYHKEKAISIPINLIQTDAKGTFVYKVEENQGKNIAVKQMVQLGHEYNGGVEIIEGLKSGDKLVITRYQELEAGDYLTIL